MFSALLLRPLALALSVSLAALAVDARQEVLCQSLQPASSFSLPSGHLTRSRVATDRTSTTDTSSVTYCAPPEALIVQASRLHVAVPHKVALTNRVACLQTGI
jgi:hypothetical protein